MNKIEYGTEFLDQLKDSVHDLYDENKELKKEIERLTAESTEWESRFYDEAKKVNKTIKLLEEARENIDLPCYDRQHLIERAINELKGVDKE